MKKITLLLFALLSVVGSVTLSAQNKVVVKKAVLDRTYDLRYYVGKSFNIMDSEQKISSRYYFLELSEGTISDMFDGLDLTDPFVRDMSCRSSQVIVLHDDSGKGYHWIIFKDARGYVVGAEPFQYRWFPFNPADVLQYMKYCDEADPLLCAFIPEPLSVSHKWNSYDYVIDYGKVYSNLNKNVVPSNTKLGNITIRKIVK